MMKLCENAYEDYPSIRVIKSHLNTNDLLSFNDISGVDVEGIINELNPSKMFLR